MAATIGDNLALVASLLNPAFASLSLDSKKILKWKCEKCAGEWTESVHKRASFRHCPNCSRNNKRTAKVIYTITNKTCTICYAECMAQSTIMCMYCNFECCKDCLMKYILSGIGKAKCMSIDCNEEFTMHQMVTLFDKKWVMEKRSGGYLHHLNKVAIDAEKAKIPATLPFVKLYIEKEHIMNQRRATLASITRLEKKYNVVNKWKIPEEGQPELKKLQEKLDVLDDTSQLIEYKIDGVEMVEKEPYIQGCPVGECRGLINSKHKCEICKVKLCKNCRSPLNNSESHKCDPNTAASISAMKNNTKACPKCGTNIFKIDGCDQMWCVECKTAFCWKTGRIETHGIHNPHYFQWLREHNQNVPRTIGDEICGGLPLQQDIILHLMRNHDISNFWDISFGRLYDEAIKDYTQILNEENHHFNKYLQMVRVNYIRGKYTQTKWYDLIQKTYTQVDINRIMCETMNSMQIILREKIIELYKEISLSPKDTNIPNKFELEFEAIREYINKCIVEENAHRYGWSFRILNKQWLFDAFSIVTTS